MLALLLGDNFVTKNLYDRDTGARGIQFMCNANGDDTEKKS